MSVAMVVAEITGTDRSEWSECMGPVLGGIPRNTNSEPHLLPLKGAA